MSSFSKLEPYVCLHGLTGLCARLKHPVKHGHKNIVFHSIWIFQVTVKETGTSRGLILQQDNEPKHESKLCELQRRTKEC